MEAKRRRRGSDEGKQGKQKRSSGLYVLGTGRHSILYVSKSFPMASAWYGGVYFPWNLCCRHRYVS